MRIRNRKKRKILAVAVVTVIALLVAFFAVLPPSKGIIPPITDESGKPMEGSVSEKIKVDINGVSQGMVIKSADTRNPVLLFLSGGPGIPEYWMEYKRPTGLEKHFTVCYWSYRGTALSYDKNTSSNDMTTEQYTSDAVTVTEYLRGRFGVEKVLLVGHSFGTYIGILTAKKRPDLYSAYVGISQISDQPASEREAFNYMWEEYKAKGNNAMVKKFEKQADVLTSDEALQNYLSSPLRDKAMHELGVGTFRDMKSVVTEIFFPTLRMKDFTISERLNIWKGKAFARDTDVVTDSFAFNAFDEVPSLAIPVYFFAGLYDRTCCYSLQRKYYETLEAPTKGFYTFEKSAHSPIFEESELALQILTTEIVG